MDIVANLTMRVAELERRLANVCRLAKVAAVDVETATVTILFEGLTMEGVPYMTQRAGEDQVYWLPSVGELGVLFAPAGDIANAIFMPSLFFKDFPALEKSLTKVKRIFRDGTTEEIDTNANSYKLQVVDSNTAFNITADGKTEIKRAAGETVLSVGTTEAEIEATQITLTVGTLKEILTAICASIVGANFFPSGLTNLQSPVGPIFFAPTPPPPSTAPTPPAGSAPLKRQSDENATEHDKFGLYVWHDNVTDNSDYRHKPIRAGDRGYDSGYVHSIGKFQFNIPGKESIDGQGNDNWCGSDTDWHYATGGCLAMYHVAQIVECID